MENPIDKDKVTESPHNLPYAHHVGGVVIEPIDKGKVKGKAIAAMYEQTNSQLDQLREQMQLIASQAKKLKERVEVSEKIYDAEIGFEPLIGHIYHLYQRKNERYLLSMVDPNNWGKKIPFEKFIASVKLLSDHTWETLKD